MRKGDDFARENKRKSESLYNSLHSNRRIRTEGCALFICE